MKFKRLLSLKNCIVCESWILLKIPLCKSCRKYIFLDFKKNINSILTVEHIPSYYLWAWTESNDYWLGKIIISLKDGRYPELYKLFVQWIILKIKCNEFTEPLIQHFAAVPSRNRSHPERLTKTWSYFYPKSENLIIEYNESFWLKQMISKSQKYLDRSQRLKQKFKLKNDNIEIKNKSTYIIDDVLVTGGSAKAVIEVLGLKNVRAICVWAYRPYVSKLDNKT